MGSWSIDFTFGPIMAQFHGYHLIPFVSHAYSLVQESQILNMLISDKGGFSVGHRPSTFLVKLSGVFKC